MSSLVPQSSDHRPRVLPKVFADVPSAAELQHSESELRQARSRSNRMGVFVFLLMGMLIAAIGAGGFLYTQTQDLPKEIEALKEEKKELEATIAERDQALDELQQAADEAIEEYTVIDKRLVKNDEIREAIRKALEEKPGAAKVRKPALGTADSHTAFEDAAWLEIRANAEERLSQETTELEEIQKAVADWKPPRRPGVDPRD
ncbi:MAG: hypothetical protein KTR31_29715 [Myxococcales bacterium]|nr:hypothetical protein [Myxococcales bacterium]